MGNSSSDVYPAHVLGRSYEERQEAELRRHCESFFRFTYRRNMPALSPTTVTSDSGWGCMLRAAQMLMGHALQRHYLGTEWRMPPDVKASRARKSRSQVLADTEAYCDMVNWFTDYPGWPHIYSLHHLVHCGMSKYDKTAGQWVGPSTAAYLLRDLARIHCALYGGSMEVLVTQGDTIYITEAETVCTRSAECRAEYIESLHISSNTSTESSEDCAESVQDNTLLHPLLVPVQRSASCTGTRMSESYDRCSEFKSTIESPKANTSVDKSHSTSNSGNNTTSSATAVATTGTSAPFFDPLLRPPPKLAPPWTSALLVLMPLMLGIHTVNKEYVEEIKGVLRHKHCVGIIGGRPNHAIYFVGYRGDTLLGLDPHTVFANPSSPPPPSQPPSALQQAGSAPSSSDGMYISPQPHVPLSGDASAAAKTSGGRTSSTDSTTGGRASYTRNSSHNRDATTGHTKQQLGLGSSYSNTSEESFFTSAFAAFTSSTSDSDASTFPTAEYLSQVHVSEFVTLDMSRLDSSLAIGFYFPARAEFEKFCEETKIYSARKLKEGKYPLFSVQNAAPAFMYSDTQEYGSAKKARRHSNTSTTSNNEDNNIRGGKVECSGSTELDKSRSFDPADTDADLAGIPTSSATTMNTAASRGSYSGGSRGVHRAVSEDSGDEDYVLV